MYLAGLFAAALLCVPTRAAAQQQGDARVQEARAHFDRGRESYRDGRLKQALEHLRRAHALSPSPELDFNLARVYERTGEAEPAIQHYLRYLASGELAAAEKAQIEARIAELQALSLRQQAQVKAAPPSSDALTAEARAFFERGLKLFGKKQYAAALAAFAAARRFASLPELAYNLALSAERLGRSDEAVMYYRTYLREATAAKDRDRVQARVHALLKQAARTH